MAWRFSVYTHCAGVLSSNPVRVTMKTPLVRKATGNHLVKSTSLECTKNLVHAGSSMRRSLPHVGYIFVQVSNSKSTFLTSPFFMKRAAPISVSLSFGPHSCVSTVNAAVGGWPSGSTVRFTPMLFPEVMNAKQRNRMYHFSSLLV